MFVFVKLISKIKYIFVQVIAKQKLRLLGVRFGKGLKIYGMPIITKCKGSRIDIGKNVVICSWSRYTALGVNHPVILRTLTGDAELIIGDDAGISGGTICVAKKLSIGAKTMLGANVTIADTDFHQLSPENRRYIKDFRKIGAAEIIIEENVFIGTNTIILKGVRIGKNSIIGAGSVVTKDIPENVIAAGNPCKIIKNISSVRQLSE